MSELIKIENTQNLYYKEEVIELKGRYGIRHKKVKKHIIKYRDEQGNKRQKTLKKYDMKLEDVLKEQREIERLVEAKKNKSISTKRRRPNSTRSKSRKPSIQFPKEAIFIPTYTTFGNIANLYFDSKKDKRSNEQTRRKYDKHLKEKIGQISIDRINTEDLKDVYESLQTKFAIKTSGELMKVIQRIINFATKKGIFTKANPVNDIAIIKADNERKSFLTLEQIDCLLDFKDVKEDDNLYLFVLLATRTGARAGSIMKTTPSDIDIDNYSISLFNFKKRAEDNKVYEGYFDDMTKEMLKKRINGIGKYEPIIKISYPALRKKLQRVLDQLFNIDDRDNKIELDNKGRVRNKTQLLYSKNGVRNDSENLTKEELEIMQKRRNNRIVVHSLRHSFAYNYLQQENSNIFDLKTLLDHSDIKMTVRYSNTNKDRNRNLVKNMYKQNQDK